jgi:hypothetical protein
VRSEARPRWPHNASMGRDRLRRGERQTNCPLPLHTDDPLPALNIVRREAASSYNSLTRSHASSARKDCSLQFLMPGVGKVSGFLLAAVVIVRLALSGCDTCDEDDAREDDPEPGQRAKAEGLVKEQDAEQQPEDRHE